MIHQEESAPGRATRWFGALARAARRAPAGSTRLIAAARAGDAALVRLLANKSSARQRDHWGRSALDWAAAEGRLECVKLLLPVSSTRAGEARWTPLMSAAGSGRVECVRFLLPHSDASETDSRGATALMRAAKAGCAQSVELLIPTGSPGARDAQGRDALMWAAHRGCARSVEALLPHCDPTLVDSKGLSALMLAAARGREGEEAFDLLLPVSEAWRQSVDGQSAASIIRGQGWLGAAQMQRADHAEETGRRQWERKEVDASAAKATGSRGPNRL